MDPIIEILVNCPDRAAAERIVDTLTAGHLIAAANVHPQIESTYFWDGAWRKATEVPLILKTREALFDSVAAEIRTAHPYVTPAILGRRIDHANEDYRRWIGETTRR